MYVCMYVCMYVWVWGALWPPSAGFGAEPRPPKGFPLFSALGMASPEAIILLIVDYHAQHMTDWKDSSPKWPGQVVHSWCPAPLKSPKWPVMCWWGSKTPVPLCLFKMYGYCFCICSRHMINALNDAAIYMCVLQRKVDILNTNLDCRLWNTAVQFSE